ncbi:MAG: hypothetical protein MR589_02920, partial [Lachnobacterium sp.]|nr:hypothetical protein [Lachnobacterium sp.]
PTVHETASTPRASILTYPFLSVTAQSKLSALSYDISPKRQSRATNFSMQNQEYGPEANGRPPHLTIAGIHVNIHSHVHRKRFRKNVLSYTKS